MVRFAEQVVDNFAIDLRTAPVVEFSLLKKL